jgi:uncharacterized membrane protein YhaH (DUF805 family)/Tfp pilus assembly major pilin PilA
MSQVVNPYGTPKAQLGEAAGATEPVKVFSVSGRIGRARYVAYGIGFYFLITLIGGILAAALGKTGVAALILMWMALVVIGFMLTIQRCHDFNASGWLSLLMLIPLVNLVFWFIPGTDGPNRYGLPTPPNSALVIVGVCVAAVLLVFVPILAAIALPAYQDYTQRARVSEVILSAAPWRTAVAEHFAETGKLPAGVADLRKEAIPAESSSRYGQVSLGANGLLTLTMSSQSAAVADKTIELWPQASGGALQWDCKGGTLPRKYRPASCRRQ